MYRCVGTEGCGRYIIPPKLKSCNLKSAHHKGCTLPKFFSSPPSLYKIACPFRI